MCTFISSLPTHSKSAESPKKKNLAIFIRPSKEKEYYKFRLLAFKSPQKSDRDYPFIERYVHQHWGKNDKGKNVIDAQVVCPVTKFVKVDGNPYDSCPICRYANMNFLAWKESGWKDKESAKLNRQFGRKFEAIIPVYVKNDPNYPQNNNHFKVLIFSDKEFYKKFKDAIQVASRSSCVFNGTKGVDFYLHMTQKPKIVNEGLPTQYTFNENVIDKFGFTKPDMAYEIPAITKEAIDQQLPFDETYYVSSTPEELQDFYDKYIKVSNDDIPDEDVEVYETPKSVTVKATNAVKSTVVENKETNDDISMDDIDEIAVVDSDTPESIDEDEGDVNALPSEAPAESDDISDDEINALVDGLDDIG